MFTSQFRVYSIGIVAANKPMSTAVAQIVPIEVLPLLDGELTDGLERLEVDGDLADGSKYTVSVEASNAVEATWLSANTNRRTPPDLRRGERVLLWQYGDADKFYWTSLGLDDHLRKLETVIFAVSATTDEEDTSLRTDNTYSLEISTHTKQITLRTSKADGEPFEYIFQFNTKEGCVTLTDDDGNYLEMDSAEGRITLQNSSGTNLVLDKKDIRFKAVRDLIGTVAENLELKVGENLDVSVGGSSTVNTGAVTTLESGAAVAVKSGAGLALESAGGMSLVAGGGLGLGSNGPATIDASGGISMNGDMTISGNLNWGGIATGNGNGITNVPR